MLKNSLFLRQLDSSKLVTSFWVPKSTEATTLPNFLGEDLAFTTMQRKVIACVRALFLLSAFVCISHSSSLEGTSAIELEAEKIPHSGSWP
jgi:hypothetical protein